MAETTTIRVSQQTLDHLARVAKDRCVSVRQLVEQLAADRQVVRDLIGLDISDEEYDGAPDIRGGIHKIAAEKVRRARSAAPPPTTPPPKMCVTSHQK